MRRVGRRVVVAMAVLGSLALGCAPVSSESQRAQSIVRNTASPFCPGMTLDACPSPRAGAWRQEIYEWTARGVPEGEIRERLQARVPGFVLRITPSTSSWLIPVAAMVLASTWLGLLAWRLAVRSRRRRSTPVGHVDLDVALDARLDEELALLDE